MMIFALLKYIQPTHYFSLSRNEHSQALAVILVDNAVNDTTLDELSKLDACLSVNYARL